ncbi:MAG: arylsulfatase A-like enzyme [Verrucomicrobiales bacterium]|jgi:arylsulfatase A-like enzyme
MKFRYPGLLGFILLASFANAQDRPNVLLIISDDQSWTDYGFMGHPHIETPHLDKLASQSLTYTRGYVTSPLCRPSLASILTGLHTHRHGITGNDIRVPKDQKLKGMASRRHPDWAIKHEQLYAGFTKLPNVARSLGESGYLSLQTGKYWESQPQRAGFTHAMTHGDPAKGGRHGDEGLKVSRDGIQPIKDFLDESKSANKPFFIWHAPFLPHTPHNPPKELHDKYKKLESNEFVSRYYAMVDWFDQTCGDLLGEIDSRGLTENTIVIYITDNGWIQDSKSGKFAPLSKQDPHEGGIRTPVMIKWPGKVAPKMDKATLVSAIDVAPTILKCCKVDVPASMKGLDLRDTAALEKRNAIYGYDGNHDISDVENRTGNIETRYVIQGDWKLLLHHPSPTLFRAYNGVFTGRQDNKDGKPELYDLAKDPHEKSNLAMRNPDKVKALSEALHQWWPEHP